MGSGAKKVPLLRVGTGGPSEEVIFELNPK